MPNPEPFLVPTHYNNKGELAEIYATFSSDWQPDLPISTKKHENLHIGCGHNAYPQMLNLDILTNVAAEVVANVDLPPHHHLPFKDNSFHAIHSSMTLEHINNFMRFGEECYRTLKHGGLLDTVVPWWSSYRTWGDPTHVRSFNNQTFTFWVREKINEGRGTSARGDYPFKGHFILTRSFLILNDQLKPLSTKDRNHAIMHQINTVDAYCITLRAIKKDSK